jgi:hypothetical protein
MFYGSGYRVSVVRSPLAQRILRDPANAEILRKVTLSGKIPPEGVTVVSDGKTYVLSPYPPAPKPRPSLWARVKGFFRYLFSPKAKS